jgi:hypothetical protein
LKKADHVLAADVLAIVSNLRGRRAVSVATVASTLGKRRD